MKRSAFFLALLSVLQSTVSAQYIPRLQLKVKERLAVPAGWVRSLATIGTQCDDRGNIYFHPAMPAPANPISGPLIRISSDGQHIVAFSLESVPDLPKESLIIAFAPGLRGEVHILTYAGNDLQLLHFDDEGSFRSEAKLDAQFIASHLSVFPTGEFLAAGEKLPEKRSGQRGVPFTAIFDRNGKLMKELSFASDVKPEPGARPEQQGMPIDLGSAAPGDDGNIYLMRGADTPLIFVISPAGELVRKLTLGPPGKEFHGDHFSVAAGKIVMEFFKPNHDERNSGTYLYTLYDASTGERQFDYETTPEAGGIFACYTPNQFTFLDVGEDGLSIVHATPR